MKALYSEITIEAPPERVWSELVDFARYGEWNPFIVSLAGEPEDGARLRVRLQPPGGRGVTLKPTVTRAVEPDTFEWLGHLGVPGIFDGRHTFQLRLCAEGTRFVEREEFRGVLVPLLARSLDRGTTAGFAAMNAALKTRVEEVPAPSADW
ncbi:MAG: SRPBCC family protein [Acidimicrobiales bacterium]